MPKKLKNEEPKRRKNSRRKGSVGERELSEVFRSFGYDGARRGQQRSGLDQADVIGGPEGWHFECKRVELLNVWDAFAQAERDSRGDEEPAVAMRRNRSPWLVVVKLEAFLALLQQCDALLAAGVKHEVDAIAARAQAKLKVVREPPSETEPVIDVELPAASAEDLLRAAAALDAVPPPTPVQQQKAYVAKLKEQIKEEAKPPRQIVAINPPHPQLQHAAVSPNGQVVLSPPDLPNVDNIPRVVEGAEGVAALRAKFMKQEAEEKAYLAQLMQGIS